MPPQPSSSPPTTAWPSSTSCRPTSSPPCCEAGRARRPAHRRRHPRADRAPLRAADGLIVEGPAPGPGQLLAKYFETRARSPALDSISCAGWAAPTASTPTPWTVTCARSRGTRPRATASRIMPARIAPLIAPAAPLARRPPPLVRFADALQPRLLRRPVREIPTLPGRRQHPRLALGPLPAARGAARGVNTAAVIVGWDNPSSYRLPGAPVNWITCWSEIQKEELVLGSDWARRARPHRRHPLLRRLLPAATWLMPKARVLTPCTASTRSASCSPMPAASPPSRPTTPTSPPWPTWSTATRSPNPAS